MAATVQYDEKHVSIVLKFVKKNTLMQSTKVCWSIIRTLRTIFVEKSSGTCK